MLLEVLDEKLQGLAQRDLTRVLRVAQTVTAPVQTVSGADGVARPLRMFCSNDYLGLAAHPALAEALYEGAKRYGAGSGASHLISGHSGAHEALEQTLAAMVRGQIPGAQALSFCTGYMANLAVLTALGDETAEIFSEELNHASLIDGARLAKATVHRYPHGDVERLGVMLASSKARVKLIVTDAVFSMDGVIAPLAPLLALAEQYDAWLVVDDAHGFGVLGPQGAGTLAHLGLCSERFIMIGTLGKAAGLSGAFVAAHPTITQYLVQAARPYIYTTASSPAVAHALRTSLEIMAGSEGDARRMQLARLQTQLRDGLQALVQAHPSLHWSVCESSTPIQPLIVGSNAQALRLAGRLEELGFRVPAIRPPTVPAGTARLRITLCATHTDDDVHHLLQALALIANE